MNLCHCYIYSIKKMRLNCLSRLLISEIRPHRDCSSKHFHKGHRLEEKFNQFPLGCATLLQTAKWNGLYFIVLCSKLPYWKCSIIIYVLLIVMLIIIDDAIARVTYMKRSMCVCGSFCHLSSRVQCCFCNWCCYCYCVEYLAVFFSVCKCMNGCVFELNSIRYTLFVSVSMCLLCEKKRGRRKGDVKRVIESKDEKRKGSIVCNADDCDHIYNIDFFFLSLKLQLA